MVEISEIPDGVDSNEQAWPASEERAYRDYLLGMIRTCARADNVHSRKDIALKLFRSLVKNVWFLQNDVGFRDSVFNKLEDLYINDNWDMALEFRNFFQRYFINSL